MDYIYGGLLGMIQGFTEFLPISSSGHLFVAQFLARSAANGTGIAHMVFSDNVPLLYVVLLHIATLCAVLVFMRKTLFQIITSCARVCKNIYKKQAHATRDIAYVKLVGMIGLSTVATIPIALLLKSTVEQASLHIVLMGFSATAVLLLIPFVFLHNRNDAIATHTGKEGESIPISTFQALVIGLVQGMAVLPGVSRSGSTIVIGVIVGLSFSQATHFSFLLAIPAIVASFALSVLDASGADVLPVPMGVLLVSMTSAFLCGLVGLRFLTTVIAKKRLWVFSLYLLIVVAVLFVLYLL